MIKIIAPYTKEAIWLVASKKRSIMYIIINYYSTEGVVYCLIEPVSILLYRIFVDQWYSPELHFVVFKLSTSKWPGGGATNDLSFITVTVKYNKK